MAKESSGWLGDEVADFLAAWPSREELLKYRPSPRAQARLADLVARSKSGALSAEEEWELNQFEHLEMLMQSIKARLRASRPVRS